MSIGKLEHLKGKIRKERNTHVKSELVFEAFEIFIELQTDHSWKGLINLKTGRVDGTKIAAELGASRNIWRKEKFANELQALNDELLEKKIAFDKANSATPKRPSIPTESISNPIQDLHEAKLKAQLKRALDHLSLANLRIQELEKRLTKYESLSELERALNGLRRMQA